MLCLQCRAAGYDDNVAAIRLLARAAKSPGAGRKALPGLGRWQAVQAAALDALRMNLGVKKVRRLDSWHIVDAAETCQTQSECLASPSPRLRDHLHYNLPVYAALAQNLLNNFCGGRSGNSNLRCPQRREPSFLRRAVEMTFDQMTFQTALVTGGAGGIGYSVAETLLSRGLKVCLVDLQMDGLRAAQSKLKGETMIIAIDVADIAAAERAVKAVVDKWGRLDILVQAAGITGKTNVMTQDVDPANFDMVLRVNLRGIFSFCRAALPVMRRQKYGRIVNIASIAGKEGNAGMLAYSTSKAAVIGLTKVIGKEVAEAGDITCNAVAPAVVRTAMVAAMPDAQVKYMTDKIPKKRTCELAEVVNLICFAASPACSFTTGFTFDCTGGRATY